MITQKYKIRGMTCAACSSAVERVTRKIDGVTESNVNLTTGVMTISYDESRITPEFIIKAVAKYFEINPEDITGKDRSQKMVEPRKVAMYMVRDMTHLSFPKMGEVFNKDHSTVKHAIDTLEEQLKDDSALREKIQDVKNSVLTP